LETEKMLNQLALVSQTASVSFNDLTVAAAAIQKQITRDVSPIWNLDATVNAFATIEDVPLGYWHVLIDDTIPYNYQGIHLHKDNGQPYALIGYTDSWALLASHECIEMLVDPSGNRTIAANSPDLSQGRVLVLVEVCDPSQAPQYGYTVNGILLSDFYTPHFFDPIAAQGVRYSFTGAITAPLQVLDGGYVTWWDPISGHIFQSSAIGGQEHIQDVGTRPRGFGTLRSFADSLTNKLRIELDQTPPKGAMLTSVGTGMAVRRSRVDKSRKANAASLRAQIEKIRTLSR